MSWLYKLNLHWIIFSLENSLDCRNMHFYSLSSCCRKVLTLNWNDAESFGFFPYCLLLCDGETNTFVVIMTLWASYQIRKIVGCACAGSAGNVFPRRRFQRKPLVSDPEMHHGTCVTHVPWCMSGSLTRGDGENIPGIPGACAPAILRIWQEAHGTETLFVLLILLKRHSLVTDGVPSQKSNDAIHWCFFCFYTNKLFNKQSNCQCFFLRHGMLVYVDNCNSSYIQPSSSLCLKILCRLSR